MAGFIRCTFFFQQYNYGWTETFWRAYNTSISEGITPCEGLANQMMQLRGDGVCITTIRLSDDIIYRDSLYVPQTYYVGSAPPDYIPQSSSLVLVKRAFPAPQPAQNAYDSIQVRMEGGTQYRREAYMRGLPAAIFTNPPGPNFNLVPGFPASFSAYGNYLTNTANGWLFRTKNDQAPYNQQPVIGIVAGTSNVTVPTGTFQVNDLVQLVGFRGYPHTRGKYFVATVAAGQQLSLAGFNPPTSIPGFKGYIQLISRASGIPQPAYQNITAVFARGQTRKSTGRPSFGPHGRRKARVL